MRRDFPPPGLCDRCRHQRVVVSGKGSRFSLCELSKLDPAFPRYPRLPVRSCAGFEPSPEGPEEDQPGGGS